MKQLIEIQQKLRIGKDLAGDGGRFKYRTAADILEAAKPILKEVNCSIILTDSIWECTRNEGRFFLIATAALWGAEGKIAEAQGVAMLDDHATKSGFKSMSNEQATGSASSYARKYALCGLFAIDDAKQDPDGFKSLETRISEAKNADDINDLMTEVKEADDKRVKEAFIKKADALRLEFHKAAMKYVAKQKETKQPVKDI